MGKAKRKRNAPRRRKANDPIAASLPATVSVPLDKVEKFWAERGLTLPQYDEAVIQRAREIIDRNGLTPPPKPAAKPKPPAPAPIKKKRRDWQVERINEALSSLPGILPDGRVLADVLPNLSDKEVGRLVGKYFKDKGWKPPSEDSVGRARRPRKTE